MYNNLVDSWLILFVSGEDWKNPNPSDGPGPGRGRWGEGGCGEVQNKKDKSLIIDTPVHHEGNAQKNKTKPLGKVAVDKNV